MGRASGKGSSQSGLREARRGADPIWWSSFTKRHPFLIHVTHSGAIDGIRSGGLLASDPQDAQSPSSNWDNAENPKLSSRPGYAYFALPEKLEDIADYYEDSVYLSGEDWVDEEEFRKKHPEYDQLWVVLIPTKNLDPSAIAADEDSLNMLFESSEAFPRDPEDVDLEMEIEGWSDMSDDEQEEAFQAMFDKMRTLGQWAEEEMSDRLSDPEFIKEDIEKRGTLAHRGNVPPEAIETVITLEEAQALFLSDAAGVAA